jgi:cob(I)alamin adenosyltransferase
LGNRLSKIYTRTGDDGTTGLGDGSRTSKIAPRIEAIGDVDELNSSIGVLLAETLPDDVRSLLTDVQHDLFDLGGELSIPGYLALKESHVVSLEVALDRYNAALPPLKEFILPGGARTSALAHVSRTVCRRAERRLVQLGVEETVSPLPRQYLNRLSDLLFVLSRVLNRAAGRPDVHWDKERRKASPDPASE